MILSIHIFIALLSIGLTTYAYLRPSLAKLRSAYGTIALTFISGFYLVIMAPSQILHVCMAGLIYLSLVLVVGIAARNKLARSAASLK